MTTKKPNHTLVVLTSIGEAMGLIDGIGSSATAELHVAQRASSGGRVGHYRGERVRVRVGSQNSPLSSAMEELGELVADRIEEEYKKKEKVHAKRANVLEKTETVRALMDRMQDADFQQKMQAFQGKISALQGASMGHFNAQLETHFKDVTHRFIALESLKKQLKGKDNDVLRSYAEQAMQDLLENHAPELWAGLNIQSEIEKRGASGEKSQEMRDFYRDVVLQDEGLVAHYNELVERYGERNLTKHVDFLIKALGADISAENPSRDKRALKMALDELYQLETLVTLHDGCALSLKRLQRVSPQLRVTKPSVMMKQILTLVGREWMDRSHVDDYLRHLDVNDAQLEVNILRETRRLIERLPAKSYANVEQRQKVMDVILLAQDDAIEHEDEALA